MSTRIGLEPRIGRRVHQEAVLTWEAYLEKIWGDDACLIDEWFMAGDVLLKTDPDCTLISLTVGKETGSECDFSSEQNVGSS